MDEAALRSVIDQVAGEGVATVDYYRLNDVVIENNFRMYCAHTVF